MSIKLVSDTIKDLIIDPNFKYDYVGYILQCMNITITSQLQTAGVNYDKKTKKFNLYVNPEFYRSLSEIERQGVMIHEIDHILHRHVFPDIKKEDMPRMNIAMDAVINQTNTMLPKTAVTLDKLRDKYGQEFLKNKPTEYYYNKLKEEGAEIKVQMAGSAGGEEGDDKTPGEGQGAGSGSEEGMGEKWITVEEFLKQNTSGETMDSHEWSASYGDEADQSEALDALKDIVTNARKRMPEHSRSLGRLSEVLDNVKTEAQKLDFKAVLRTAIKRSMPANNFQRSWNRPNRRLGVKSAGKVIEMLPKLTVLFDTSGSIGLDQINMSLGVLDGFLGIVNSVDVHFFHTQTYKTVKKVKKGYRVGETDLESGGTDLTHSFSKIIKEGADLVVVLTDGYFGNIEVEFKKVPKTVFIIDKQGKTDHPWHDKCATYIYE